MTFTHKSKRSPDNVAFQQVTLLDPFPMYPVKDHVESMQRLTMSTQGPREVTPVRMGTDNGRIRDFRPHVERVEEDPKESAQESVDLLRETSQQDLDFPTMIEGTSGSPDPSLTSSTNETVIPDHQKALTASLTTPLQDPWATQISEQLSTPLPEQELPEEPASPDATSGNESEPNPTK